MTISLIIGAVWLVAGAGLLAWLKVATRTRTPRPFSHVRVMPPGQFCRQRDHVA